MSVDIEKLEDLAKAATPGPWFVTCNCTGKTFYTIKNDRVYIGEALGVYNGEANAAYIAAACNAVPELIKMYREAEDKANNAWRILLEAQARIVEVQKRVQELEQQNSFFLKALKEDYACPYSRCKYDFGAELDEWGCSNEDHQSCWVQAAKEAGE